MQFDAEIYNYKRILDRALSNLKNSEIGENDKASILRFHEHCIAQGLSLSRTIKYVMLLRMLSRWLEKSFENATKEDIFKIVQRIEQGNYSDWTKHDYKAMLRIFYRWLRGTEEFPEEVKWIRPGRRRKKMLPEELLAEDEVKRMAEVATNPRDKALILVLYESGCRIGEILTLRIKHVQFDEYGAQLIVNGKTGMRRVRVIASAPKLAQWLDNHPLKGDPGAPLWVSIGTRDRNSALCYSATKTALKDIANKAGIKKRVYPYLFRHSRATILANHLTEAQLKQHFGWIQDSRMAATYVHLSGKEVDSALLKLQGFDINGKKVENKFEVAVCPRCDEKNSPTSKFCSRCAMPFDLKIAANLDEVKAKADKLLSILTQDPEILDKLLDKIEQLKAES